MAHVTRAAPPHTDNLPHLTGRTRSPSLYFIPREGALSACCPWSPALGLPAVTHGGRLKGKGLHRTLYLLTSIHMSLRGTDMHLGKGLRVTWHR